MEATKSAPQETEETVSATPTIDQILAEIAEDHGRQQAARVNVFAECIKDGQVAVHTEAQASEIARLITRAEADLDAVKATAAAMIARAQARLSNLEFIFMTPLAIWTSAKLAGAKKRSLILEGGQLSLRKVPMSVKTTDPEALLAWAQAQLPAAVEMVPKVKSDAVKEWEKASGEIAPGRTVTPEGESFKVSVPK